GRGVRRGRAGAAGDPNGALPRAVMAVTRPRVTLLRGHSANPWDLRPWELLADRYDVRVLATGSNAFALDSLQLPVGHLGALRDRLPRGRLGGLRPLALGDRSLGPEPALARRHLVLSVGRLVWEKGHQDLLRALAWLRYAGLRPRALIVGTGPEEQRLRAYAGDLGVEVEWLGGLPHEELPAVFARASCFVLASLP